MILLDAIDIVGYKPSLTTFQKDRYKSKIGKVFGLLTLIPLISFCIYFTIDTFQKNEISIIFNQLADINSSLNLTNSPMLMFLTNGLNATIPDQFHEIRVNYWTINKNVSSNYFFIDNYEIPLESCDTSKHLGSAAPLFQTTNLTRLKCIPYDKYDLSLKGIYGDSNSNTNSNTFINIAVNMCNNITMNNTCPDVSILEYYLKNVYLVIVYIDYEIDHYDVKNPIKPFIRTTTFPINWDLHSRYFFTFKSVYYKTDMGLIYEDKNLIKSYQFANNQQNVQIRHGSILYPGTIGTVTLSREPMSDMYNRGFAKLQTLLAKIGGVVQGFMIIGKALSYILTKNLFLTDLINSNFKNDDFDAFILRNEINMKKSFVANNNIINLSNASGAPIRIHNIIKKINTIKPEKKEKRFKPSCSNIAFHNQILPLRNNQSRYMYNVEEFLKKWMSYDYLFKLIVDYDRLKRTLFTLEQLNLFENLPKMSLEDLQDKSEVLNKTNIRKLLREIEMKGEDNINNNLLKYFKNKLEK